MALYREGLRKKRNDNLKGYLTVMRRLALQRTGTPLGRKAARTLKAMHDAQSPDLLRLAVRLGNVLLWAQRLRAATTEANRTTARIERAVVAYITRHSARQKLSRGDPGWGLASTELTPSFRCCARPQQRCRPHSHLWSHPTWRRLGFRPSTSHALRYRIQTQRARKGLNVTVTARGEPFCDHRQLILTRTFRFGRNGQPVDKTQITWQALAR
jgi:hypothetical protein